MKRKLMKAFSAAAFALAWMAFAYLPLSAATITMKASDESGKSSFDSGLNWPDGNPPSPENDYVVPRVDVNYTLRTPNFTATEPTNLVFKGKSLSIGDSTASTRDCVFGIATAYTNEAKKATITVNDLRLYGRNIVRVLKSGMMMCLAGGITIYRTDYPAHFWGDKDGAILEIASTVTGTADNSISFSHFNQGAEFRVTGDMSTFLGAVYVTATANYYGGRLVLACPYAAKSTTVNAPNCITLGPNFSYVGTGTMEIPAGTRFAAAYDAGTGTTIPVVMDTTHFTLPATGGFELALDTASLPAFDVYAGKVLPIVKIPRALREVTEADFTDVTPGLSVEYGLPSLAVQVDVDGEGMQTVSLVAYPYVKLVDTSKKATNPETSDGRWYLDNAESWSNGNVPSRENDYLSQFDPLGNLRVPAGNCVFEGHSLTLVKNLALMCESLTVSNFVMVGGSLVQAATNAGEIVVNGTMRFRDTTSAKPAKFAVQSGRAIDLRSSISGDGFMRVYPTWVNGMIRIRGDNSAFTGQIAITTNSTYTGTKLVFDSPENLGGSPSEFNYKALAFDNTCILAPSKPMTLATENRGIYFDTLGKIVVTNGTFGIMQPIRMTGAIQKEGGGVLALGGDFAFGADGTAAPNGDNNVLNVVEGGIMPLTTNGFARLAITFGTGSRLVADAASADANVRTFGLFNNYGAFMLPSDGKLRVSIVNVPADVMEFSVPICTVTEAAAAALTDNVAVDKIARKSVVVRQESVSVNGQTMVRFVADMKSVGFSIIFR